MELYGHLFHLVEPLMPWTPKQFAKRHNHKLKGATATKAASMANAMLRSGVPEGEAIATANKRARGAVRKASARKTK